MQPVVPNTPWLELEFFITCTVMRFYSHLAQPQLSAIQLCLFNTLLDAQPQQHGTECKLLNAHTHHTYPCCRDFLTDLLVGARGPSPTAVARAVTDMRLRCLFKPTPVHGALAPQPLLADCTLHSPRIGLHSLQRSDTRSVNPLNDTPRTHNHNGSHTSMAPENQGRTTGPSSVALLQPQHTRKPGNGFCPALSCRPNSSIRLVAG